MLQTPQKYPRAGSQSYPSPAAEAAADGSTTVYFGPTQPEGVARGNWVQTDPKKGWFTILRLYSPLPSFFDKSWRPSEIELVGGGGAGQVKPTPGKETLLEKIEDRVDRRQVCAAEADKKDLGILDRVSFMQECINR
jgi:hypothetical protein